MLVLFPYLISSMHTFYFSFEPAWDRPSDRLSGRLSGRLSDRLSVCFWKVGWEEDPIPPTENTQGACPRLFSVTLT